MDLREFAREVAAGRMPPDRAMWLMEQHPQLRADLRRLVGRLYEVLAPALAAECAATVEEAEQILAREVRRGPVDGR